MRKRQNAYRDDEGILVACSRRKLLLCPRCCKLGLGWRWGRLAGSSLVLTGLSGGTISGPWSNELDAPGRGDGSLCLASFGGFGGGTRSTGGSAAAPANMGSGAMGTGGCGCVRALGGRALPIAPLFSFPFPRSLSGPTAAPLLSISRMFSFSTSRSAPARASLDSRSLRPGCCTPFRRPWRSSTIWSGAFDWARGGAWKGTSMLLGEMAPAVVALGMSKPWSWMGTSAAIDGGTMGSRMSVGGRNGAPGAAIAPAIGNMGPAVPIGATGGPPMDGGGGGWSTTICTSRCVFFNTRTASSWVIRWKGTSST